MEYPSVSEYREAILSAEDNFKELYSLRPVIDSHGYPVMSSGNVAVVFKMRDDKDGKFYAVKCFIKDQVGRDESYRKIADELETVSSSYILPLRYLEKELFVDSLQCDREEFPVVVMEWVEGESLDVYVKKHLTDTNVLEMLSYRFNRMSAWLLSQPFAHGDLKPDNILVREDGSLVLVDYDGMFVSSMQGEKAREMGSPGYTHPLRQETDFNEHIDDFSISVIALSLKAIAISPKLKENDSSGYVLLLSEKDLRAPQDSEMLKSIQTLTNNSELSTLLGVFYIALGKYSLDAVSFRLFMTEKPKLSETKKDTTLGIIIDTSCTDDEISQGMEDGFGVVYSKDGSRLLKCNNRELKEYSIKPGTKIICDYTFEYCDSLQSIAISDSVISIGVCAFGRCRSLQGVTIPDSVISIGDSAFEGCRTVKSITIPDSVNSIGNCAFKECIKLQSVTIPGSVTSLGKNPFIECKEIKLIVSSKSSFRVIDDLLIDKNGVLISCFNRYENIDIPDSVTTIGDSAFEGCRTVKSITIPDSVTSVGNRAFKECIKLQSVTIPYSVHSICDSAFSWCRSLQRVIMPDSVTIIGSYTFYGCRSLQDLKIPDFVTSIGRFAFGGCELLGNVTMPDSVTALGENPFWGCEKINLHLSPNSFIRMINELLIDSKGVLISCLNRSENIEIPRFVTSIGDYAFGDCGSLQRVTIPDSVSSIGEYAFDRCVALQKITIPDSVKVIGGNAFHWCESLQRVSIPESVSSIGKFAFPDNCEVIRK